MKDNSNKTGISSKDSKDIDCLIEKKINFFQDVIQKTILHVERNKNLDILGISEVTSCIEKLKDISEKIKHIDYNVDAKNLINNLQSINDDLSCLFKIFGTHSFEDLLMICFGNNYKITTNQNEELKYDLLKKYFHPTGYKVITNKASNTITTENDVVDIILNNMECVDISEISKPFFLKVSGISIYIHNKQLKKFIIVTGILDDLILDFISNNYYINEIKNEIKKNKPDDNDFKSQNFDIFIDSLTLKDYLVYSNPTNIYSKYVGYLSQNKLLCQKQINQVVKDFISEDLYGKRNTLIYLLIKTDKNECLYLAYLLYDLLTNDSNGMIDTQEQKIIFDSFPWIIKQYFKYAMKKTNQYTNELSNFDINKIPLEQQICLMKVNDTVKEKAMLKLKEVKAKSEDSGSKARQYLDGLLKIPFSIYKKEPILNVMDLIKNTFKNMLSKHDIANNFPHIPKKDKYTSVEIFKYTKQIESFIKTDNITEKIYKIKNHLNECDKKKLIEYKNIIDAILKKYKKYRTNHSKLSRHDICYVIFDIIDTYNDTENENKEIIKDIISEFECILSQQNKIINIKELSDDIEKINSNMREISEYMCEVKTTLDQAIYGHTKAKTQIERIIGQWINGEQSGYCFGFEGPPGLGKTSLAKRGLSNCLKDENGISRPFAMIQMGGDSNGSTLHGHNYTYVGSTWGSIVQILIDKKCMNPIIFIDEVDKISKTEHGREIVGILTHLLDQTQNDSFQDKYFNGIDLDLSKALFVLSYNDVDAIDKVLLDRIHRIKFDSLSLDDKLIICNNHILPEIYKKMGFENMIVFLDDTLKYIIEEYTCESGVRKLKELLFEIISEINLDILKNNNYEIELPIKISIDDVKNKYCRDKQNVKHKIIHSESSVGIINGLWANAMGRGGIIPIQADWRPSDKFLSLHLTGSQGDVMKESMNVALTLAWNLTPDNVKKEIVKNHSNNSTVNGIHVHCPEGAVPKDGPSAGAAITTVIYSILNNIKIRNDIAITGEICLNGNVTEIGGLDLKILGAIKAGVKEILFPSENLKDFNVFMNKYKETNILNGIKFHPINKITDIFNFALVI